MADDQVAEETGNGAELGDATAESSVPDDLATESSEPEDSPGDTAPVEESVSDIAPEESESDTAMPDSANEVWSDTPVDVPSDPPAPCGSAACASDTLCCSDVNGTETCVDPVADDDHCGACDVACREGEHCAERACVCDGPDGAPLLCSDEETCCPGAGCFSLGSDAAHCGACDAVCGTGETCDAGTCQCGNTSARAPSEAACLTGQSCCGQPPACLDARSAECVCGDSACGADANCCEHDDGAGSLVAECISRDDPAHCGSCDVACAATESCRGGECVCADGRGDCDLDPATGCETPLDSDANCGACGWVCLQTLTCSRGTCVCEPGLADCNGSQADGCEADLSSDANACGSCGNRCGARATCERGACACDAGFGDCNARREDGCETYLVHNDAHCGGCGIACGDNQVCASQRCGCAGGFGDCNEVAADGCETSLTTDANCGSCGAVCPDGTGCAVDTCICDAGRLDCNHAPADGCEIHATEDLSNCGRCGNICPRGQTCSADGCVIGAIDLTMTRASVAVASVKIGTTLEVTNTLVNGGNAVTTAGYIEVAIYASTDNQISDADTMLGTRFTNILGAGGASTVVTQVTIPKTLQPGIYYIGAVADYSAQQAESDESNNSLAVATVEVVRDADLVMSAVSLPVSAVGLGGAIDITNTMTNQGSTILSAFYAEVALYLSEDPNITTSDVRVATRFLWSLDPGASSTAVTPGVVPANMAPGLYYLGAIADFSELQPESNESNNALAGAQIEVYRATDLVISEVSTPVTRVDIGQTLEVTNTVRNQGTTYASNTYVEVALYLSSDATITTADRAIGSRYCANLGGGGASTAITTAYVPASVEPGRYYVGALADPSNTQPETDEANNGLASTLIEVVRDVDLRIAAFSLAVSRVNRGASLEVTSAIANGGTTVTSAPYLQIGFYLSRDANITTEDRAIGWRTVNTLAPNATSTGIASVVVPADVASGSYYIGAIADPNAQQPESDETNNQTPGTPIEVD